MNEKKILTEIANNKGGIEIKKLPGNQAENEATIAKMKSKGQVMVSKGRVKFL